MRVALDNLAARLQLALSAGGLGTWSWDRHTGTVTWDATMERLYGMAPGTGPTTYDEWATTRDDDAAAVVNQLMAESARTGEPYVFEQSVTWPDGTEQSFDGLEADKYYRVVQGNPKAEPDAGGAR